MRLSTDKDDAEGYAAWQEALSSGATPKIYLDGVEQAHVYMADDQTGEIRRGVVTEDGKAQVGFNDPEAVWTETVRGKVEIKAT